MQVNSACCEDNADALTHHEILMPGQLLCKFMKVGAECVGGVGVMEVLKHCWGVVETQFGFGGGRSLEG